MEQGVPGSQNEHFFELLHPNSMRGSPPMHPTPPPPLPPVISLDATADGSSPEDASPVHSITPSYDFHLTHSAKSAEISTKMEDSLPVLPRASSLTPSAEHVQGASIDASRGIVYRKPIDTTTDTLGLVTMDAIERTIKQYTDSLLDVLESVNGRLFHLETTVQGLENTIAGLKSAEGEKQDQSNGRLMNLERLIEEVNRGVQFLYEKQRLDEVESHMAKFKLDEQKLAAGGPLQPPAEGWQQPKHANEEAPRVAYSESAPQLPQHLPSQYPPPPAQAHYPPAPPPPQMQAFPTSQSMVPLPPAMNGPPPNQQPYPSAVQHIPPQQASTQAPPHNPPQAPAFHSQPPTQLPPPSSYNVALESAPYGHMQPQNHLPPPPGHPSSTYLPEPPPYAGGMHGGPRLPPMPQEVLHSTQQHHNPVGSQYLYESAPGRIAPPAMAPSYGQSSSPKPAPSMYDTAGGGGGGYGTSPYPAAQPVPSAPSGGGAGYPRLPMAQPVQHGLTSANPIASGPPNRQGDDVVERFVNMGFNREQVRGVVRQLSETGKSVDYNVVLDKLMNGGDSLHPARGWFNRG